MRQSKNAVLRNARTTGTLLAMAGGLMLGACFLALRVQVDVAEEFGKQVRA